MQEASERSKIFAPGTSVRVGMPICAFAGLVSALLVVGCAEENYPVGLWMAQHQELDASAPTRADSGAAQGASPPATGVDAATPLPTGSCPQAAAQPLPQRLVVMSATVSTAGNDLIYVSDLFERFKSVCGSCHGPEVDPPGLGGFQIQSSNDFSTAMTKCVLQHVTSDGPSNPINPADPCISSANKDPNEPMPPASSPNGGPYDQRPETDPVKQFAELVTTWLADGSPQSFSPAGAATSTGDAGADGGADAGTPSQYSMTTRLGDTMTNIGSCVPDKSMVGVEQDLSVKLDAMFAGLTKAAPGAGVLSAQLIGLPEHLSETDLVTFDTATLAQYGVIAYQPNYPLWSDDAGKLRYVRVPRGTSIQLDKSTQEFKIPPNTRFYKTFMKKIVDTDGSYRFRKVETRLIVSRPDQLNADGTYSQTALFGTYQWNANETDAVLLESPLRDALPFSDTLIQYTTDEQLASEILAANPASPLEALLENGAARHYAIPSSDRCVQCHMGSNSASFVLGFRPVQIKRRELDVGGTILEPGQGPPGADELTQLQRLVDYGVITGVDSLDDVLPLEQSEGTRAPRSSGPTDNYELIAQGYMVGNCAHCHNPRGFPSVTNPVLVDVLNFLPSATGGIFQFPLERFSPRIGRGPGEETPIPYITPSLMDQPSAYWNAPPQGNSYFFGLASGTPDDLNYILYAPWRSLIFRNVNTPFAYETDLALFPHMPMNTPGFDCRAQQIMSDWMVSIPSIRKDPEIPEYAFASADDATDPNSNHLVGGTAVDANPQPYVEVLPGTPGYGDAALAAQKRLTILHGGVNPDLKADSTYSVYSYCPNTSDILDPAVELDPVCHPVPTQDDSVVQSGVAPARPHWVNTDLTQAPQAPGTFAVRRTDWPQTIVDQTFPEPAASCTGTLADAIASQNEVKSTVGILQNVFIDCTPVPNSSGLCTTPTGQVVEDFRTYATTEVPFGLWENKPACNFSKVPTAGSYTGSARPLWMSQVPDLLPSDPVYTASPGAAVFGMICINCHGPNADAHGRLADNLATMTGGNAIVADFKDGLFGPLSSPGQDKTWAFADSMLPADAGPNWTKATIDDRASRYLAQMALGGTEVQIPLSILTIVGDTRVLGAHRVLPTDAISANMLSAAKAICGGFLDNSFAGKPIVFDWTKGWFVAGETPGQLANFPFVIASNGDAELWLRLCSINNPPPIRALQVQAFENPPPFQGVTSGSASALSLIDPGVYGSQPAGDQNGLVGTLGIKNAFPWCIATDEAIDTSTAAAAAAYVAANNLPACPIAVKVCPTTSPDGGGTPPCWSADRMDQWAIRGAINAGLAVFTYVEGLVSGLAKGTPPKPTYDACEQLQ
jgi:mono/diheme cytochrome c family protein